MNPARVPAALGRAAFGLLALASVATCLAARRSCSDVVDFFSYFTFLSNLLGGTVLIASAVPRLRGRRWLESLRGAAALYLVITGLVYALVLGGEATHWTGWVQHRIMPVAAPLDWLLFAPAVRLPTWRALGAWLVFPIAYLGYTLIHGALTDWYPYPFLDPARHGWRVVTTYAVGIAAYFVVIATILLVWADLNDRLRTRTVRPRRQVSWNPETSKAYEQA